MPSMNEARCNPGLYISPNDNFMYIFQGFIKPIDKSHLTPITETIERLDLNTRNAKWELV